MEVLTVEVSGKFGPKAIKDGDGESKWFGVKKPLKASNFEKGKSYEVELEEWQTGRYNITKAKEVDGNDKKTSSVIKEKAVKQTKVLEVREGDKNKRILVQGITQAVTASPSVAGLPYTTTEELVNNIKEVAEQLISFVEKRSQ